MAFSMFYCPLATAAATTAVLLGMLKMGDCFVPPTQHSGVYDFVSRCRSRMPIRGLLARNISQACAFLILAAKLDWASGIPARKTPERSICRGGSILAAQGREF